MLRDKMLAVMDEVNSEVAERQELVRMIALALLSGSNLFILGAPGQAKSFCGKRVPQTHYRRKAVLNACCPSRQMRKYCSAAWTLRA